MVTTADAPFPELLRAFVDGHHLRLVVCENTLRGHKLTQADLLPFVGTVPVAIAELIRKQEEGWAYIKAGL
jgi:intracellular sulfur oxidation DsrE/DsrF family protein